MTIQQKRDALFTYCVRTRENLAGSRRDRVTLEAADIQEAVAECGFEDEDELRDYIRDLYEQGLLVSYVTGSHVGFQITTRGYEQAEELGRMSPPTSPPTSPIGF